MSAAAEAGRPWIVRWSPLSGLIFIVGAVILAFTPAFKGPGDTPAEVVAFAEDNEFWTATLTIFSLASLFLLGWFVAGLAVRSCSCPASAWPWCPSRPTTRTPTRRGTASCTSPRTSRSSSACCSPTWCWRGGRGTGSTAPRGSTRRSCHGVFVLPDGLKASNYLFFAILLTPLLILAIRVFATSGWSVARQADRSPT